MDEEDPTEGKGVNQSTPRHESLYGKRSHYYQQNPIDLYESESGRRDLQDTLNKGS